MNNFKLNSDGTNSYIHIMNNGNYLSIFFYKDDDLSLYRKNIYPPICNNINKNLYQEADINIIEFFDRKPDTNYYLIFDEFNTEKIEIRYKHTSSSILKGQIVYLGDSDELILSFILIANNNVKKT